jgi:hypothetical protein
MIRRQQLDVNVSDVNDFDEASCGGLRCAGSTAGLTWTTISDETRLAGTAVLALFAVKILRGARMCCTAM